MNMACLVGGPGAWQGNRFMSNVVQNLVEMSRELGKPANDYVVLGEGNSSALERDGTFWVKASGISLRGIGEDGFVQVYLEPILALLEERDVADDAVKKVLSSAMVNKNDKTRHPSVETTFHALVLTMGGASFAGHTHPTAVNSILCSRNAQEAFAGRLFPDEIVVCGPAPAYVPYTDPGLPLALAIRDAIASYADSFGRTPKVILLQNHGLIALGKSAVEVLQITAMLVKAARVILGTYQVGGPNFLDQDVVDRIDTRPDELYRRRALAEESRVQTGNRSTQKGNG